MNIQDLALAQELSRDEQAAVRGGDASNTVLALMAGSALVNGGAGVSIGSPVVQANPQSQTITPTATDVDVDTKIANVLQSANTFLGQF
ncbi:hypothetical protein ABLV49_22740 (plasmid) [Polaromonas hydrogenivorans]|uniref:Uncharacterized protein n=1 Tax=Polaromonas hydrogenivorans TaxID=335476 RepID=A0AAU7LZ30_9BURK